jgi:hypothetical protein
MYCEVTPMTKKESMSKLKAAFHNVVSANRLKSIKATYSKVKNLNIDEEAQIPVSVEKEVNELV